MHGTVPSWDWNKCSLNFERRWSQAQVTKFTTPEELSSISLTVPDIGNSSGDSKTYYYIY